MKGKYAARAALRRDDEGVRSELESYQHNVRRLTEENHLLKEQAGQVRAAHKAEMRKLRAQLDEGLSPELAALRKELERQRALAREAKADSQFINERHEELLHFTAALLHDVTGCTGLEATEAICRALGIVSERAMVIGQGLGAQVSKGEKREAVATLQRTRGFRSGPRIVAHLSALCDSAARELKPAKGAKSGRWRDT